MPLVESGQDRTGKAYSKAAYGLFPRYRLDAAIEIEVERITGQRFRSLEEARRPSRNARSSWFPYTVAAVVQKAPYTSETPEPSQTPSGSQIPAEGAS
jgi:hypothetical protein